MSNLRKLLAARRMFDVKPIPTSGVIADVASGAIDGLPKAGFYAPKVLATKMGLPRPTAFYDPTLPNARAVKRHEAMHGIFRAAKDNPELADAVPLWARARGGPFEDELLARLASRDPGAVLDWQVPLYRNTDPHVYAAVGPMLRAARFARDNPVAVGAAAVGVGGTLYGILAPDGDPEETAIADEFDRQVLRRTRPAGY
jgi:hypothetical protein